MVGVQTEMCSEYKTHQDLLEKKKKIVEYLNNFYCIICSNNNHGKIGKMGIHLEMHYSLFISLAAPGLELQRVGSFVAAYGI